MLCVTARGKLIESVNVVYHSCRQCELFSSHIIMFCNKPSHIIPEQWTDVLLIFPISWPGKEQMAQFCHHCNTDHEYFNCSDFLLGGCQTINDQTATGTRLRESLLRVNHEPSTHTSYRGCRWTALAVVMRLKPALEWIITPSIWHIKNVLSFKPHIHLQALHF